MGDIRPRERDTIVQALSAGVVPRIGLQHVQVGRAREIAAIIGDIARIADNGSAVRFVIGDYGAGKTFFLTVTRAIALQQKLVTLHADLAPDRRLHASNGQARSLYGEAVRNLATRTKPEGGALASLVEKFVSDSMRIADEQQTSVARIVDSRLISLQDYGGGYDFATVLKAYWSGHDTGDEGLKLQALRWLRAEFSTKTEARQALNVRTIIDDTNVYESFKLLAAFVRLTGYSGLLITLDEMVNLYKLQSAQARSQNYEQILHIVNDSWQGPGSGLGFVFGGTPEFLTDTRRGLYSYTALQTRLAESAFATGNLVDFAGPVIRLQNLTPEDLYILLQNIRNVFAGGDPAKHLVPDEALPAFMAHCNAHIGEAYFRTPRNTIKGFSQLLSILEQNPDADWRQLIGCVTVDADGADVDDAPGGDGGDGGDDDLTELRI